MFKQAAIRKHLSEQSYSSVRVFLSILAQLAHLAQFFVWFFIGWINELIEHANTKQHFSKHSWISRLVILSILAHLAHLAWFYFSLIFSSINIYNCSWFDLTNKENCRDWRKKLGEKCPMLTTFCLTVTAAITGTE